MKIVSNTQVGSKKVEKADATGCSIQWLLSKTDGTPNFAMREITIQPGGNTPIHSHDWEHLIYVLEGQGIAESADDKTDITVGHAIFVPGGEHHTFRNTGESQMRILCMIPNSGDHR